MADHVEQKKELTESEQVKLWQERISLAENSNKAWAQESGANRFVDEYNGKWGLKDYKGNDIPIEPINAVFAYVQTDIAITSHRNPYIAINPKQTGTIRGAKMLEAWINYQWRELQIKEETDLEVLDKDLIGFGVHKVGYAPEYEGSGDQLKVLNERIFSLKVNWKDLLWNIGTRRIGKDSVWMAEKITRPLKYWKSKYESAASMKGVQNPEISDKEYQKVQYKDDIEVGIAYEVWDTESRKVYLVGDGINDKFLNVKDWPEYLDEFPYQIYWDYAVPGKSRPMSAIAPWESQVLEEMFLLAQAVNHVKRWNRQLFIRQGTVDSNSLDKFEKGNDGAVIEVGGQGTLNENMKLTDFGQLPVDFYLLMDRVRAISRFVSGMPEIEQGGVTKTQTRTYRELVLVKQGAKGRQDRKVARYEDHLKNIARHMLAHFKANFDGEQIVKIMGNTQEDVIKAFGRNFDPNTGTLQFTVDEIQGEYDVDVVPGSTLPLDKEARLDILNEVLKNMANAINAGVKSPFVMELVSEILDEYDIPGLEKAWEMERQLMAVQQKQTDQTNRVESAKSAAQAEKTAAQANKADAETAILEEQLTMAPDISQAVGSNGAGK